jgi:hypothetical protein
LDDKLPALAPVAIALLINLQAKVFMLGGINLCFHTLRKISIASLAIVLAPFIGSWTCKSLFRNLKASLGEQLPLDEGLHFTASLQSEGTARVF